MKLHFLDRSTYKDSSFTIRYNDYPYFLKVWHYHPELELVYIRESTGTRFIGDNIKKFEKEEVVLIGPNLPHMWFNDEKYFSPSSELRARAYVVHFRRDFMGVDFFNAPELQHIKNLIEFSRYGIKFLDLGNDVKAKIADLSKMQPFDKWLQLMKVLDSLAKHPTKMILSSEGFLKRFKSASPKSMYKVYEFIFNHFNESISLKDVANVACMNPSAFSRLFKRLNRKTFKDYLNEIRIGYACKLISENEYNITRICYESGYNNISNFNRQFRRIMGKSPSQYRKQHMNL
ncbi:AraC family transcriptional regulator [Ulvibacterium sp.]|uniref:AraC family transcriptional regulator n=1 Tax=Ulvibacterium sp. TaxID=2665914 RepID=UPI003BAD9A3C